MADRRRSGRPALEPQRASDQGVGRRHDRALPERGATHAREWLSNAIAPARLGRKHEYQVASADPAYRSSGYELLRGPDLCADPSRRKGVSVLFHSGGEVVYHPPLARTGDEGSRLLRDFRRCLFGQWSNRKGNGVRRCRQDLGTSSTSRTDAEQGVHAIPRAVALGRRPGGIAESGVGRSRLRTTNTRRTRGRSRRDYTNSAGDRFSQPTLQRNHELVGRAQRGGEACIRVSSEGMLSSRSFSVRARPLLKRPILESRSIRPRLLSGTSTFCRTERVLRPVAVTQLTGPASTPQNVRCAMVKTAKVASTRDWLAAIQLRTWSRRRPSPTSGPSRRLSLITFAAQCRGGNRGRSTTMKFTR